MLPIDIIISGIYKIINKINQKYYVGSSANMIGINGRKSEHFSALKHNRHCNQHLQNAFNKYGKENFEFITVEEVSPDKLLMVEQKYLDIARTERDKCYNMRFVVYRTEITQKISKLQSVKRIKSKITKERHSPMRGKHHSLLTRQKISKSGIKAHSYKRVAVKQIDKNTNEVIKIWDSITHALMSVKSCRRTGISNIVRVCKKERGCKTAFGYKWEYTTEKNKPGIAIKQIDIETGKIIRIWASARQASKDITGKVSSSISAVLKKNKTGISYGFRWEYVTKEEE